MSTLKSKVNQVVPKSLRSKNNLAEDVKEYETVVRGATVYLFTRPVDGRSDEDDSWRHWSLVFDFEDSTVRYVEGNEHEEKLMAFYFKVCPRESGTYYELGEITTSPNILRAIAVKNILNYTDYCFTTNNCQNWVKQYAKDLGHDVILSNLNNHLTLREASPLFAHTAASSTSLWKSVQKSTINTTSLLTSE